MKAIDLHIHTIKTIFDADFSFDIKKLEEYVNSEKISCIAITAYASVPHGIPAQAIAHGGIRPP